MKSLVESERAAPAAEATAALAPATDVRNTALTVIAVLAVILLLQYAQAVVIPVVLGVLISYALEPCVAAMQRLRIPRPLGAAVLLVGVTIGGAWLVYGLRAEAAAIVDQLPEGARRLRQQLQRHDPQPTDAIEKVQRAANELEKATAVTTPPAPPGVQRVLVQSPPFNISDYLMTGSVGAATAVAQLVLLLFLVYFLLASGDLYRRKLVKIAGPSLSKKKVTVQILSDIDRQIERFLLVQLFTSAIVAIATWLAFRGFGVHQAGIWGLLAGIFNSIPYLGPVVVTGVTAMVAFLQFGSLKMALLVGVTALAITSLEGFLLTPWLTSRAARMNAVAVFVNILFWGWVWNVWGMLLAVPILMVIKAVCDHVDDFKPIGELIGD